jgi:hypothetical protein
MPSFDRFCHRGMCVQRPIKKLLALSHAGFDWVCHRANSLRRFVAHRVRISVASHAPPADAPGPGGATRSSPRSYPSRRKSTSSYSYSAKRYSYSYSMAARWLLEPQRAAIVRSDRSPWSNRPAVCGPSGQDIGSNRRSPDIPRAPEGRCAWRKVAGTFHVPSARFNQAHLSPWLSAERSLTALSDGCNRMERTRNAFPRLVSSLHLYGCETGCDMRD